MIVGVAGACRKSEITYLQVQNIKDEGTYYKVKIPNTKTKTIREFIISEGDMEGLNFVELLRMYINLRPPNIKHDRFFVCYKQGKCGVQAVGINTIGNLPKEIATFIGLANPSSYTGHCFRRSSATLLADSGADILKIKRHGGWKSSTVAEGYVEDSVENKRLIAANILGETSNENHAQITATNRTTVSSGINISNCSHCVINIYKE